MSFSSTSPQLIEGETVTFLPLEKATSIVITTNFCLGLLLSGTLLYAFFKEERSRRLILYENYQFLSIILTITIFLWTIEDIVVEALLFAWSINMTGNEVLCNANGISTIVGSATALGINFLFALDRYTKLVEFRSLSKTTLLAILGFMEFLAGLTIFFTLTRGIKSFKPLGIKVWCFVDYLPEDDNSGGDIASAIVTTIYIGVILVFTTIAYHLVFLSVRKIRREMNHFSPNENVSSSILASQASSSQAGVVAARSGLNSTSAGSAVVAIVDDQTGVGVIDGVATDDDNNFYEEQEVGIKAAAAAAAASFTSSSSSPPRLEKCSAAEMARQTNKSSAKDKANDKIEQKVFNLCVTVTGILTICYGPTCCMLLYMLIKKEAAPIWLEVFSVMLHSLDYLLTSLAMIRLNSGFRDMYYRQVIPKKCHSLPLVQFIFGKRSHRMET